jgi:hypothetical protein
MRNSQSATDLDKQPASNQQADDDAEQTTNGYYYDDSTGYETYQDGDDESDEED